MGAKSSFWGVGKIGCGYSPQMGKTLVPKKIKQYPGLSVNIAMCCNISLLL